MNTDTIREGTRLRLKPFEDEGASDPAKDVVACGPVENGVVIVEDAGDLMEVPVDQIEKILGQ